MLKRFMLSQVYKLLYLICTIMKFTNKYSAPNIVQYVRIGIKIQLIQFRKSLRHTKRKHHSNGFFEFSLPSKLALTRQNWNHVQHQTVPCACAPGPHRYVIKATMPARIESARESLRWISACTGGLICACQKLLVTKICATGGLNSIASMFTSTCLRLEGAFK